MDRNTTIEMLKNHRAEIAKMKAQRIEIDRLLLALVNPDPNLLDKLYEALSLLYSHYYEARYKVDVVNTWLCLLYDDERFLLSKHLVGGLTWPHVMFEYEMRWGKENGRSERTMKRIQAQAIDKIISHLKALDK